MELDIQYLLLLQNLRNATGGIFDELFNAISKFAVDILPFLPYILFWCVDKGWGYRFLGARWGGEVVNGVLKLSVCAYRPWIRSDRIEPAGDSKVAATGYSFPSGHTMMATVLYGSVFAWQRNKRRWLAVLCAAGILMTAFSRNFLGVHTPQDVIVGFIESLVLILVTGRIYKWLEGNDRRADLLTVLGLAGVVIVYIYILRKSYPMDYVEGKLLVDPVVMMYDTFGGCGGFTGFLIASYVDRHYIHYEIPKSSPQLPILAFTGFMILFAWKNWFAKATVFLMFGRNWGNSVSFLILVLFAMIVWPLVIRKFTEESSEPGETVKANAE